MKIKFGTFELVRGISFKEQVLDLELRTTKQAQISPFLGSEYVRVFDRNNLQMHLQFRVTRQHPSAEEAQLYALIHANQLFGPNKTLALIPETGGQSLSKSLTLISAVLQLISAECKGSLSTHFYRFIGSKIQET